VLADSPAFSGFSVDDLDRARQFYEGTLGLSMSDPGMGGVAQLHLGGGKHVVVYAKPDHVPATYTVLNFPVPDIEAAVDALAERGVQFQHYEHPPTDERGIMRAGGPLIAWFTDPAGNVFSVLQES
jgi:predicted enzyme related to lactoylglutathione lyase